MEAIEISDQEPDFDPRLGAGRIVQMMIDAARADGMDTVDHQKTMDMLIRVYPGMPRKTLEGFCWD